MGNHKNKYAENFQLFLETVYLQDGVEGLANSLPFISGAFVVTIDGKIVAANDRFINLVDYARDELYGMTALDITYKDDRELVNKNIREYNKEPYFLRLITKYSDIKFVYASPHIFEIDGIIFRLAEFVDHTELINLKDDRISALKNTAHALANTIERRDPYTHGHMHRTALISAEIAKLLTLSHESIEAIYLGASIHDMGKIAVPIEILIKPGKLEDFEWEAIKQHPVVGEKILANIEFVDSIKDIVLHHHENQDGSGYPDGLTGNEISLEVAIVNVADSLEAIAGVRPYREANTFEDSIAMMKSKSYKYHTEALAAAEHIVTSGKLSGREFGLYNQ